MSRNSLCGFCRVRLPSGLVVHDVAVHRRDEKAWVSPPGRPMLDRAGAVVRDNAGKVQYAPTVTFTDRAAADRFSAQVLEALRAQRPEALQ